MTADPVAIIKDVYRQAVEAVHPATVIPANVRVDANGWVDVAGVRVDPAAQPVYAIAIGKAAAEMLYEVEQILGDHLTDAIAVTKAETTLAVRSRVLLGAHPVPDERSLAAGAEVLQFAQAVPAGALVICLISGGGSALVEALRPGLTLGDLQETTRALLRAGASIHELNAVRARLSRIKAGGLLWALRHATVVNLIISDVLGDDLSTIASGPTVSPQNTEPAEEILARYGVDLSLPDPGTDRQHGQPTSRIVASLNTAIDAAVQAARGHGLEPVVLARALTGEARHVATTLAAIAADAAAGVNAIPRKSCIICGGETTVTVVGDGIGGRNTEAALAAALHLGGVNDVTIGFLASDGDDGVSGVAGAIVSGQSISDDRVQAARQALANNDSYTFLSDIAATWDTGTTGTNVNDLVIAVVA